MSKTTAIGWVVLVVVLIGGGILLATHKNSDTSTKSSNSSNTTSQQPQTSSSDHMNQSSSSGSSPATATNSVTIENFAFSPANITIKKGTTVTWTNKDATAHNVTETDGQNGPKSSVLAPGKSFVFTFDNPGTYKYHCSIHPDMTGTVTVTE